MKTEMTLDQNLTANKTTAKLIKVGRDDFDLTIAHEMQRLIERIKQERELSNRAARKVATEFIGEQK